MNENTTSRKTKEEAAADAVVLMTAILFHFNNPLGFHVLLLAPTTAYDANQLRLLTSSLEMTSSNDGFADVSDCGTDTQTLIKVSQFSQKQVTSTTERIEIINWRFLVVGICISYAKWIGWLQSYKHFSYAILKKRNGVWQKMLMGLLAGVVCLCDFVISWFDSSAFPILCQVTVCSWVKAELVSSIKA